MLFELFLKILNLIFVWLFFHKFEVHSSYKLPKDSPPLADMDWLASDLPIATHSNGAILVMTMDLKSCSSAMAQMDLDGMFQSLDLSVLLQCFAVLIKCMLMAYAGKIFLVGRNSYKKYV